MESVARCGHVAASDEQLTVGSRWKLFWDLLAQSHTAPLPPHRGQVVLFGESAGAGSIAVHLTSPDSWPLGYAVK